MLDLFRAQFRSPASRYTVAPAPHTVAEMIASVYGGEDCLSTKEVRHRAAERRRIDCRRCP